ncbi:MAG: Bax inhibitor-1 family protein [Polyangiaceae bacterium]|nr:Bax inhibitor-1 family protein [Polyangiaceae bacterium]
MTTSAAGFSSQQAIIDERAQFLTRTYNVLFLAILAFTGAEVFLFQTGLALAINTVLTQNWLLTLGGFVLLGWLGSGLATRASSNATAFLGLGIYVVLEAIIFVPLLMIANAYAPGAIESAAVTTLVGFAALTFIAWKSKKDFTFLGTGLRWAGVVALLLIVASVLFGFQLGIFFSVAMVGLAGASILYSTSNIMRNYPSHMYVAAALSLFSSVALMFYYVLSIFISNRD